MRRCFVAFNSKMSNEARSVTPPLKSAQARKMFSVVVIAPSPGHVNLRQRRAQHCGETGATGVLVKYLGEGPPFAACPQVLWPAGLRGPQSRNRTFHALLICQGSLPRRIAMRRISCSILTSGLMSLAVCGITQAAPLRPLPTVISNATALTSLQCIIIIIGIVITGTMVAILSRASGTIIALTGRDEARTWSQLDKQRGAA
jgi:hypothetical protein